MSKRGFFDMGGILVVLFCVFMAAMIGAMAIESRKPEYIAKKLADEQEDIRKKREACRLFLKNTSQED